MNSATAHIYIHSEVQGRDSYIDVQGRGGHRSRNQKKKRKSKSTGIGRRIKGINTGGNNPHKHSQSTVSFTSSKPKTYVTYI